MGERAKKVLIAGGLCGATMLIASDKIKQRCSKENQGISVKIQSLSRTRSPPKASGSSRLEMIVPLIAFPSLIACAALFSQYDVTLLSFTVPDPLIPVTLYPFFKVLACVTSAVSNFIFA